MKVNFQSVKNSIKNLPWQKFGNVARKAAKYTGIGALTFGGIAYCGAWNMKYDEDKAKYQALIKEADIDRYNKMCEDVITNKNTNDLLFWENGYKEMVDSIRIANRAYFEGAQMVRDSIKNIQK